MSDFEKIELLFSNLLVIARSTLSDAECAEIQEYIDVGEYGIALRTAVSIFVEENKKVNAETRSLLDQLARTMAIDPEKLLTRLA